MTSDFDRELEERLLRYAAIDSQSDETSRSLRSASSCVSPQMTATPVITTMSSGRRPAATVWFLIVR